MPYRLASVEEQKAYEAERIREAKMGGAQPGPSEVPVVRKPSHVVNVDLTQLLEGCDLKTIAVENSLWKESYGRLKSAHLSMTVRNLLNGRLKKGIAIKINGKEYKVDGTSS